MVRGEEEATIVIDVGSSSAKAGFSGEDTPRAVCPSVAEDLHLSAEDLSTYRARRPEVCTARNRANRSQSDEQRISSFVSTTRR